MARLIVIAAALLSLQVAGTGWCGEPLAARAGKDTVMVAVFAKPGAEDYIEYADGVLKERLKSVECRIVNQQMADKLKKDRLLLEAIKNANATAMAKINSDFGAGIVIRATLQSVLSFEKLGSWEGAASVSLTAIDTRTGEEIDTATSDPMGGDNPAPVEESSLSAKQMAIKKALDNLLAKMGFSSEVLSQTASVSPAFHAAFEGEASAVAFSPDSTLLAAASGSAVKVWDVAGKSLTRTLAIRGGDARRIAFSQDGKRLAALSHRGEVTVFSMASGAAVTVIDSGCRGDGAVSFSPDGTILATAGEDGYLRLWDSASGRRHGEIKAHGERIHSLCFDASGKTVISASDDLTVKFWDLATRRELKAFQEPMDRLTTAAVSNDRTLIAYASKTVDVDLMRRRRIDKRFLRLREVATGRDVSTFEGHAKDINAVAFLPGRRYLVSGGDDNAVIIWDMEKRGQVTNLEQNGRVSSVAVTRDGKWLCAASNEIVIWKLK